MGIVGDKNGIPAPTADRVLRGLDQDQRAAVTAPEGIVVVRAGAGSGKTTVLTRRIAWRVLSDDLDPARFLAITFTRQAATEMRARLAQFELDGRPVIGTFHAVARRLMHQRLEDKGRRIPVIINNRASAVSACMGDDARKGGVFDVINAIDWAHSRMLGPTTAVDAMNAAKRTVPLGAKRFAEVFDAYERTKKKRGVVDLNDFLLFVVEEAARDPRYAESIRFQFHHVSVDEAQDMNPLQYEFLRTLSGPSPDLFLVGDPNQAIYGFNGADRTLFDTLPGMTGAATVVSLPSNYRCTPEIVGFAVDTLAADGQHARAESRRDPGAPVALQRCADETSEREAIVKAVLRARTGTRGWNDIAVLCRINAMTDDIRQALEAVGIPVRSARRGGDWARAVSAATALASRDSLATWAADILDSGEYSDDDTDVAVARLVRDFLDDVRSGSVDGRMFGSWLATSATAEESQGVEVLTFHAAKGREWSFVVVAGAEKGMLPHRSARDAASRGEEARLAYVGLTRAADELLVTWTDKRGGKSSGPSPWLPALETRPPVADPPPEELRARAREERTVDPVREAVEAWRRRTARFARVSPDTVMSVRTMRAIARDVPRTIDELVAVTDAMFAARHGESLLAAIAAAD